MQSRMIPAHPGIDYRPEITGLRALAVLPVILFHAGFPWFGGGYVGVDVFFVISGYLITSIILREKQEGTFSLARFYERRIRRILPALLLVILVTVPFAWHLMGPQQFRSYAQSVAAVAVFASNILFWRTTDYFDSAAEDKPLLHTWSLGVEEQYYVVFPLLVIALWHWGSVRFGAAILALAALSFGASEWLWQQGEAAANFFLAPSRAWELLLGSLLAYLGQLRPDGLRISVPTQNACSAGGLGLLLYAIFFFDARTPFPGVYALIPVVGAALIIACAGPQTWVAKLLSMRWIVAIGLISYSAYLWHQPIFAFARIHAGSSFDNLAMTGFAALSLILAYFSWRYVEVPARTADAWSRKAVLVAGFAASLLLALLGLLGQSKTVIEWRFEKVLGSVELLQSLHRERNQLARSGQCSFGERSGGVAELEVFLRSWRCHGSEAGFAPLPVMFVGDSHSADRVMALRLQGFTAAQLGGGGCSLVPSLMTPLCRTLFDHAIDWTRANDSIRFVALSNRFVADELTPAALEEMLAYWRRSGKELIVFTGMPEFPGFRSAITKAAIPPAGGRWPVVLEPDYNMALASERAILGLKEKHPELHVVNSRQLFCGSAEHCAWQKEGVLLMMDESHLSRAGAMEFGRNVAEIIKSFAGIRG